MKINIKKFLLIILALSFIFTSSPVTYAEEAAENFPEAEMFDESKMGDTDGDGKVTSADARLLLRCSVALEEISGYITLYGDFDKDGVITAEDARKALRVAVALDSIKCILYGHEMTTVTVNPDCTSEGYAENRCISCTFSEEKTHITAPSGHIFTENTTTATCTEDGIYTCFCTVCGFISAREITEKASGHSFGIWNMQGETKSRICSKCSYCETAENKKTIYLTFDDGPGPYTAKLLSYLKEYGVKATFFVTNQMPRYRYLLKDIVNDGHAIAVHTLTHQWSIYSSSASYINDFNAMHQIILEDTGVDTRIFRFPGGTNNTVSRSYSRGIMSSMARYMTDAGYIYFDWDIDCGDTLGYSSSKIAQYTINQLRGRHSAVILMHDIKNTTVESIRTIIRYGLDNGYEFAVIDESTPRVQFRPVN